MAQKTGIFSAEEFRSENSDYSCNVFALDITADRAAVLTGLYHNSPLALYRLLRERMAELAQAGCPFRDQVELNESYFGPARHLPRAQVSGQGAAGEGWTPWRNSG